MTKLSDQIKVPHNSISCFIGRICKEPSDSFANDGILYVDLDMSTKTESQIAAKWRPTLSMQYSWD